jgi:cation transport regulator
MQGLSGVHKGTRLGDLRESNFRFISQSSAVEHESKMFFNPKSQILNLKFLVNPNFIAICQEEQAAFWISFNSAQDEYEKEEAAFKVAWSAVKRDYEKGEDGNWHKKPD